MHIQYSSINSSLFSIFCVSLKNVYCKHSMSIVTSEIYSFIYTYQPDSLYLREQVWEVPWLFFETNKGPGA